MNEPDPDIAPVRRFKDPAYAPQAATLGELRTKIDALDEQIVALLAQRALCVRDATRFKRDPHQVAAPARQAQVFAKVRAHAGKYEKGFHGFSAIVDATYRTLVAGCIAGEQEFFKDTEVIA